MNRIFRRYLVISVAVHALLLLILVVGPAFMPREQPPRVTAVVTVIPSRLVDEWVQAGAGAPAAPQPSPAPAEPVPRPTPVRPPVQTPRPVPQPSKQAEPVRRTEPKPTPPKEKKPEKPKQAPVKVSDTLVTNAAGREQTEKEKRAREEAQRQQAAARQALSSLRDVLSASTEIQFQGIGQGDYANYASVVQAMYDRAWVDPRDVQDTRATVIAEVTVNRDGRILSQRLVQKSGNRSMDRSVENALDRVRLQGLPRFPDGAKDQQRVFRINFNLSTRRLG